MKKALSVFLVAVFLLTTIAVVPVRAKEVRFGEYNYSVLNDGTAELTLYRGTETTLTIPSAINGYTVTSIGSNTFSYTRLHHVKIPNSVTNIGERAFSDNSSLASIILSDSLTSIGSSAFACCEKLASITLPGSVTHIGNSAFYECKNLTSIAIPDSVSSIGYNAFYNTPWYENQPDGLVYAGKVAYQYKGVCPTSITFRSDTTGIADKAFSKCSTLKSVTIPDSVMIIGNEAFFNCNGLNNVKIGKSARIIGEQAFRGCSMKSITLPDCVTDIGDAAFADCRFTTFSLPVSVKKIGSNAFLWCENLERFTIPDTVTYISDNMFSCCKKLASITIPRSVTSIGASAFSGCDSLTDITIPDSVTSIGNYAFTGCNGLKHVTIPKSVVSITIGLFSSCKNLTSVTIPDSIKYIASGSFSGCTSLSKFTIPDSVTRIGSNAFSGCTNLTNVTISGSVKYIEDYAFLGCVNLTNVKIPRTVESIGTKAFGYDKNGYGGYVRYRFTIKGYKGTAAEEYAKANETGFIDLNIVVATGISLNTTSASMITGNSLKLTATITPSNATDKTVVWSSDNTAVASVSNGMIKAVKAGTAVISAKTNNGKSATCKVTVKDPVLSVTGITLNESYVNLTVGESLHLIETIIPSNAANKTVTWSSSNPAVATVSNYGYVRAVKSGSATITVKSNNGKTATCKIIVNNPVIDVIGISLNRTSAAMDIGDSLTLVATITPSNATNKTCRWSSSNPAVATVSSYGEVKAVRAGSVTITARSDNDLNAICRITVAASSGSSGNRPENRSENNPGYYSYEVYPDGTAVITKYNGSATSLTTPSYLYGHKVVRIGREAFSKCKSLTSVNIVGVREIGDYAFSACANLTSVTISGSVKSIGYYAFIECLSLKSVTIPKTVTSIGARAFGYYDSIIPREAFSIYGAPGSAAEEYAKDNGFFFVPVSSTASDAALSDNTSSGYASVKPAAPKIAKLENTLSGIKISWNKSNNAAKYRVYRRAGKGKWKKLGDTTKTHWVNKKVKSGTKYTYTVRCISKDGKRFTSGYNKTGWSRTFIAAPALPTLKNTKNGVKMTIKKVTGATYYLIFRKTSSTKWKKVAYTKKLNYVDKNAKKGVTYIYTIRCVTSSGAYASGYNANGRAIKCVR